MDSGTMQSASAQAGEVPEIFEDTPLVEVTGLKKYFPDAQGHLSAPRRAT